MSKPRSYMHMIQEFVTGNWDYKTFDSEFYFPYVEDKDEPGNSEQEQRFLSSVHDKMDFVAEKPLSFERRDGWLDPEEFKRWIVTMQNEIFGSAG